MLQEYLVRDEKEKCRLLLHQFVGSRRCTRPINIPVGAAGGKATEVKGGRVKKYILDIMDYIFTLFNSS